MPKIIWRTSQTLLAHKQGFRRVKPALPADGCRCNDSVLAQPSRSCAQKIKSSQDVEDGFSPSCCLIQRTYRDEMMKLEVDNPSMTKQQIDEIRDSGVLTETDREKCNWTSLHEN